MNEAHFCSLPTQSNVYGLTNISLPDHMAKLLVACLRGKVFSIEHKNNGSFGSKEAQFTYIPGDAEIVSIDAFCKAANNCGVVIGITFVKNNETKPSKFLNIYSEWEPETEFNMESIAQGCFNLELPFTPYQLYHAELISDDTNSKEMVFLLSGNDRKVHMFREDIFLHIFGEHPVDRFFPEFANLPSNVIWIEIKYLNDGKQRLTAMGCQDGYVRLVLVNAITKDIMDMWSIQHDSPVTSIKLFVFHSTVPCPDNIQQLHKTVEEENSEENGLLHNEIDYHLLVCGALELTVVYRSVLRNGLTLSNQIVLPESNDYDCVLCACVADFNFDGYNEIILGTYGQELLIYGHYRPEESPTDRNQSSEMNNDNYVEQLNGAYRIIGRRSFSYPLLAIEKLDLSCDGMEELAVLSQNGLHILQHNPEDIAQICLERLKLLLPSTSEPEPENCGDEEKKDGEKTKIDKSVNSESIGLQDLDITENPQEEINSDVT